MPILASVQRIGTKFTLRAGSKGWSTASGCRPRWLGSMPWAWLRARRCWRWAAARGSRRWSSRAGATRCTAPTPVPTWSPSRRPDLRGRPRRCCCLRLRRARPPPWHRELRAGPRARRPALAAFPAARAGGDRAGACARRPRDPLRGQSPATQRACRAGREPAIRTGEVRLARRQGSPRRSLDQSTVAPGQPRTRRPLARGGRARAGAQDDRRLRAVHRLLAGCGSRARPTA